MKLKRAAALVLCLMMAFALTGCFGNTYEIAGTIDGTDISSGLYLMAEYSALSEAKSLVEDSTKDVLKQKVEGQNASAWVKAETEALLREYVLVRRLAREKDIQLDSTAQDNLNQMMQYWTYLESIYLENGINQDTFYRYLVKDELKGALFNAMYAEGGDLHVPDDELKAEYETSNANLRIISVPSGSNVEEGAEDHQQTIAAMVDAMVEALKNGDKTMEQLTQEDLPAVYALLGRDFDVTNAESNIYTSYVAYSQPGSTTYSEDFLAFLQSQSLGEFGSYNMGTTIMVYEKIPVFASDDDFTGMRDNVLKSLKSDAFNDYLAGLYEQYPVQWKFGVRWYLRPQKLEM